MKRRKRARRSRKRTVAAFVCLGLAQRGCERVRVTQDLQCLLDLHRLSTPRVKRLQGQRKAVWQLLPDCTPCTHTARHV